MINKDMMQEVYSTEEVKTNKVWIDGKPIYRKVIANNVSCGPSTTISLSSIGIDTLIEVKSFAKSIWPFSSKGSGYRGGRLARLRKGSPAA